MKTNGMNTFEESKEDMNLYYDKIENYTINHLNRKLRGTTLKQAKQEIHIIKEPRVYKVNLMLKKYITEAKSLLDFGCGFGDMCFGFEKIGYNVFGVEVDYGSYEIALFGKNLFKSNVNLFNNLEEFEKYKNTFDVILINQVVEHLDNPKEIIKKLSSKLNPGGIMIVSTPNRIYPVDAHSLKLFESWLDRKLFTWWGLRDLMSIDGFQFFDITPDLIKNYDTYYPTNRVHFPKYMILMRKIACSLPFFNTAVKIIAPGFYCAIKKTN
jgi:2-polyprenyl-3-methyl-5-hydroxy-6-metoxy-1,4-benzoquinol methylase